MKKISRYRIIPTTYLLLFSCFFLLIPSFLAAQIADGKPDNVIYPSGDEVFNSVKIGIIFPQGTFSTPLTNPEGGGTSVLNSLALPFKGIGGLGAKPGFNLQYEGFSSLAAMQTHVVKQAHFGIQYGLDFGYIPLGWDNIPWANYHLSVGTSPFFYVGIKVGPAFYFSPSKDMGIGFYGLIDPYVTAPGGAHATYSYIDGGGNKTIASYSIKDSTDFQFNINVSAGINIYYKAFIIGLEYNWMHTRYNAAVSEYQTYTQSAGPASSVQANYSFGNVLQTNILKLTFGVRLGYGDKGNDD